MHLGPLDWSIIATTFAVYLAVGLWAGRTAGSGFEAFFLGNRGQPWWLLGTSMVATTFATDTPNLVAGIVREYGVFGNWLWWAFLLSGTVTTFFFARLWRRSGVLTDVEFYELRYSGRAAAWLRGFRAAYLGILFNVLIMANVTLAAIKIGGVLLGLSPLVSVATAAGITLAYSMAGGLTGVLLTDLVQFAVAMAGSVAAAAWIVGLPDVGGLAAVVSHPAVAPRLALLPDPAAVSFDALLTAFLLPLGVQWWSAYYPGAEPGGGGYVVQRILAAKDERHAAGAALFFNVMHYAVRPWPWILVGLASLVVFPSVESLRLAHPDLDPQYVHHDLAYPAMLARLPPGLMGLVVASLIAAYMSTISTQMNWGSSIVVNDLYRRFVDPGASPARQVLVGRVATAALLAAGCGLALVMRDALSTFQLVLQVGAGTGLLFMVRWFWWRINAAAEIAAMVVSFVVAAAFFAWQQVDPAGAPAAWQQMLLGVAATTIAWLAATFLGSPTDRATLESFVTRVRPGGPGWRAVTERMPAGNAAVDAGDLWAAALATVAATVATWGVLFAIGLLLYGQVAWAVAAAIASAAGWLAVRACWSRLAFH
ncbi:MAG: Na+:solute symporter [Planctomycetes bacterium]|nr:Na+:solute symporter [Planctomycetota bacterium]